MYCYARFNQNHLFSSYEKIMYVCDIVSRFSSETTSLHFGDICFGISRKLTKIIKIIITISKEQLF